MSLFNKKPLIAVWSRTNYDEIRKCRDHRLYHLPVGTVGNFYKLLMYYYIYIRPGGSGEKINKVRALFYFRILNLIY